jgi:DNA polymerase-3 subunit alpha
VELAEQARAGLRARLDADALATDEADYWARLDREVGVIARMGFAGYFLIVSDFIKYAKLQGIPVGPGRGSGAGSMVAWALTITDLDPLRFGLLFERFLNPERVSMPDFDIDFCQERREEVISYVQKKYGDDRVAQIITFGTLQARAVLRDTGRVMQLPLGLVDRLCKMVPNNPANPVTLAQAIEIEPRLQEAKRSDQSVSEMLDVALKLEGLYRNASTHAAGVVIGDRPLVELSPLYLDPRSDIPATQFNMKWVESAGLVKFDFLGPEDADGAGTRRRFLKKRGRGAGPCGAAVRRQQDLRAAGVRPDDRRVPAGIAGHARHPAQDALLSIEEITALISLYRPGPMDNIDTYVDRKFGRQEVDVLHPSLEPVLQGDLRRHHLPGAGDADRPDPVRLLAGRGDLLRRAMGKKIKAEMEAQKARFIEGAAGTGARQAGVRHLRPGRQVRGLRLQQVPCRRLRPDQLSDGLPQGEPPGGVLRRLHEPGPRQYGQAGALRAGREEVRRNCPSTRHEPLRSRLRRAGGPGALRAGRGEERWAWRP